MTTETDDDTGTGSTTSASDATDATSEVPEAFDDPRELEADAVIKNHVVIAMAAGLAPIPVFDIAVQVGNQVKMVHSLSEIYGVSFKEAATRATVLSLVGGSLPTVAVAALSSGAKLIPGFGSLAGGAGVSLGGGATTYAVGRVFANHFADGGDLVNFEMSKAREMFRRNLRKGRKVAADAAEDARDVAKST